MELVSKRITIPRSARFFCSDDPESLASADSLWFALHGYGQLADQFLHSLASVLRPGRIVIAPEALSRFYHSDHKRIGASWMTSVDRLVEIDDQIRYLDLLYAQISGFADPETCAFGILGFSQGVAAAARWVSRGAVKPKRVVLWGEAVPPEFDSPDSLENLRQTELVLVAPSRDEFLTEPRHREQKERLQKHGLAFVEHRFEGGHRLDDDTLLKVMDFS